MAIMEIPLSPDNQRFAISINNTNYKMRILWREINWILDIQDENGTDIITGIPLVTGVNLLAQYAWLRFDFGLWVVSDSVLNEAPGQFDLGYAAHLCIVTEAT